MDLFVLSNGGGRQDPTKIKQSSLAATEVRKVAGSERMAMLAPVAHDRAQAFLCQKETEGQGRKSARPVKKWHVHVWMALARHEGERHVRELQPRRRRRDRSEVSGRQPVAASKLTLGVAWAWSVSERKVCWCVGSAGKVGGAITIRTDEAKPDNPTSRALRDNGSLGRENQKVSGPYAGGKDARRHRRFVGSALPQCHTYAVCRFLFSVTSLILGGEGENGLGQHAQQLGNNVWKTVLKWKGS